MKKITTEEFIQKARTIHGDRYDYSKVKYVNNSTNIIIICRKHGEFEQTPTNHYHRKGCPKCVEENRGQSQRLTQETFLNRAKEKHGDRYDYSKAIYINSHEKVTIICRKHGDFNQKPQNHLRGDGCPRCNGGVQYTKDDFIQKAIKKHGDKYDYSLVEYVNTITPVKIICREHGEFIQAPNKHLQYYGCQKCSKHFMDTEYFIEKAREKYGDKYDYSKVIYVNNYTPLIIICREHGEFKQASRHHLKGCGCPKCSGRERGFDFFLEKAEKKHGNKYDYSKAKYVKSNKKIIITCPIHGDFPQTPSSHVMGSGCPKCAGKGLKTKEEYIEEAKIRHNNRYDYSKIEDRVTKVTIICPIHGKFKQSLAVHAAGAGCQKCAGRNLSYVTYEMAKKIIQPFGIKLKKEYHVWWKANKDMCRQLGLPYHPDIYYKRHK